LYGNYFDLESFLRLIKKKSAVSFMEIEHALVNKIVYPTPQPPLPLEFIKLSSGVIQLNALRILMLKKSGGEINLFTHESG
jgi:hypothetical protein